MPGCDPGLRPAPGPAYEGTLTTVLRHRRILIFSILGLAVVSFFLLKFIGSEFYPEQDEGQFTVTVRLPVGTRSEETDKTVRTIEHLLQENVPEIQAMITDIGVPPARSGNLFSRNTGSHAANIQVALVGVERRRRDIFEIVRAIRPKLAAVPGATTLVNPGGFMRFLLNFGSAAPIDVEVRGFDLDAGSALARQVAQVVRSTPGATDVQVSREENLPELRVRIDRDKAGALGVSVASISGTINTCINGSVASLYTDPVTGAAWGNFPQTYSMVGIINGATRLSTLDSIYVTKSTDGGVTFSKPVQVSTLQFVIPPANTVFRDDSFPAPDIAPGKARAEIRRP